MAGIDFKKLRAFLADVKFESKDKLILIGNSEYGNPNVVVFTPCKEDSKYFTMDVKMLVDADTFTTHLEPPAHGRYPMKLWDKLVAIKKKQGYKDASSIGDISDTEKVRNEEDIQSISNKITKETVDNVIKNVKSAKNTSKEDFDKTFDDTSDVIFNIANDAKSTFSESQINKDVSEIVNSITRNRGGSVQLSEESRKDIGEKLLKKLDDIYNCVKSAKRGQAQQFRSNAAKLHVSLITIYGLLSSLVAEHFPFYRQTLKNEYRAQTYHNWQNEEFFENTLTNIKAYMINRISALRMCIKDTILNPDISLESVSTITDEEVKGSLEKAAKNYANIATKANSMDAEEIKQLLEDSQVTIHTADQELVDFVKKDILHNDLYYVKSFKVWKVVNAKTEAKYKEREQKDGSNFNEHLFWHGSPNKNWQSIVTTGLSMKYASPGMFGKGIYFADESKKSYGYTSGEGSRWANGKGNRLYLAIFKVNLGRTFYPTKSGNLSNRSKYDTISAMKHHGFLHMNEYVIYDDSRCTIHGLVEITIGRRDEND